MDPARKILDQPANPLTNVVRIEINRVNGTPFDHTLAGKDIKAIWTSALGLDIDLLQRYASYRNPSGFLRVNFRLKTPTQLERIVSGPEIQFEKPTLNGIDVYSGRVLDIDTIAEAKLGDTVTVIVKRTSAELSEEQITEWLMRFGKILSSPR